jgi:hypothetical protein
MPFGEPVHFHQLECLVRRAGWVTSIPKSAMPSSSPFRLNVIPGHDGILGSPICPGGCRYLSAHLMMAVVSSFATFKAMMYCMFFRFAALARFQKAQAMSELERRRGSSFD